MEPVSIIAIISLVMSVVMTAGEIAAQEHANKENINNQHQLLNQQQEFAKESAAEANQVTAEQYMTLYSPAAKVKQLKEAGLSPGLMYGGAGPGGAGTTAAQAATPSPTSAMINPLLQSGQMNNVMNALKTITEAKKTEKETKKVDYEIENLIATTKKTEEEAKTNVVTRNYQEMQVKLAEKELEFQNATLENRIELVEEELNIAKETVNKTRQETKGLRIDNQYKGRLYQSTLRLNEETTRKIMKEQALVVAQEALAKADAELRNSQKELTEAEKERVEMDTRRLKEIVEEYEMFGYSATEAKDMKMELINTVKSLIRWITGKKEVGEEFRGFGGPGGFGNVGGGGTW